MSGPNGLNRRELCPWCWQPRDEHHIEDGHLHVVYLCDKSPVGWRGVFTDRPVETVRSGARSPFV